MTKRVARLLPFLLLLGCESETVLQVDLEGSALGSVPAVATVGTVQGTEGSGASVRVVPSPQPAVDPDKWVRIGRAAQFSDIPSLRGQLSAFQQDGNYLVTARLFVPSGGGVATLQLEPLSGPELFGFFHVDFHARDGSVHIDDGPPVPGLVFPRDEIFSVAINLNVSAAGATATVTLLGAASGSVDVPVTAAPLSFARQFNAVRLWMGFPHSGAFFADDLAVLRSPPG